MPDVATFRALFPEFVTSTDDATVTAWFGQATFNTWRLGTNYDMAVYLFTAHSITLGLQAAAAAAKGIPGAPSAPITSKAAGGLSVSYDPALTASEGAGIYNATVYGQRLWKLLEQSGLGGFYTAPPPRQHIFGLGRRLQAWR